MLAQYSRFSLFFFFSSRRRHTRCSRDWSSDVCSSDLYVTERWLGGTLTNFQTIKKQIKRLKDLEQGAADGEFENYTKKEQLLFDRERVKLEKYLNGIKNMGRLPGA